MCEEVVISDSGDGVRQQISPESPIPAENLEPRTAALREEEEEEEKRICAGISYCKSLRSAFSE